MVAVTKCPCLDPAAVLSLPLFSPAHRCSAQLGGGNNGSFKARPTGSAFSNRRSKGSRGEVVGGRVWGAERRSVKKRLAESRCAARDGVGRRKKKPTSEALTVPFHPRYCLLLAKFYFKSVTAPPPNPHPFPRSNQVIRSPAGGCKHRLKQAERL